MNLEVTSSLNQVAAIGIKIGTKWAMVSDTGVWKAWDVVSTYGTTVPTGFPVTFLLSQLTPLKVIQFLNN